MRRYNNISKALASIIADLHQIIIGIIALALIMKNIHHIMIEAIISENREENKVKQVLIKIAYLYV